MHRLPEVVFLIAFATFLLFNNSPAGLVAEEFEVEREADVQVPMRDGTKLLTDIYFPVKDGDRLGKPLPAVLMRSPYGRQFEPLVLMAKFFAQHGYASLIQDTRGPVISTGDKAPLREAEDGFDTVQWVAGQTWCDGKVGMHGPSALANFQFAAAALAPPALVTIIPWQGAPNYYHGLFRRGGALHLGVLYTGVARLAGGPERPTEADAAQVAEMFEIDRFLRWTHEIPWERGKTPLAQAPAHEDYIFRLCFEETEYRGCWRQPSLAADEYLVKRSSLPILWLMSWQDWNTGSAATAYESLIRAGYKDQCLIIGPWSHVFFAPFCGDVNFGDKGARIRDFNDVLNVELVWFDRWLKQDPEAHTGPSVSYFVMGGGDGRRGEGARLNHGGMWQTGSSWPPRDTQETRFYLRDKGTLSLEPPAEAVSSTTYRYDPRQTVSILGRTWLPFGPRNEADGDLTVGPRDQIEIDIVSGHGVPERRITARSDVVQFQTDPLPHDITVVGNIEVTLWVASSAPDTDFFVRLLDAYPASDDYHDGYQFPVSEGILRARYREGFETSTLMVPSQKYQLTIPLEPSANRFKAGHRIQVFICSSAFPTYDVNRNVADTNEKHPQPADNTIFHESEHRSFITLPVARE